MKKTFAWGLAAAHVGAPVGNHGRFFDCSRKQ